MQTLTQELLSDPVEVQLQSTDTSTLVQRVFTVNKGKKTSVLAHLITQHEWPTSAYFCLMQKTAVSIWQTSFISVGIIAEVFHGE